MTQTEKEQIRDYVISYLIANSQTINGLPDVTSLEGISSFPVIQKQNGNNYIAKKVPFDMMITEFRYNSGYIQYKDLTTGNWINIISDIELAEKIDLSRYVNIDMDQIINGVKTFNNSPIVPDPTTPSQASTKGYVDHGLSLKVDETTQVITGNGLIGGGSLAEDRTININPADDSLTVTADNIKVNTNNTLTSTSTTQPLSANQGKVLNDKVVQVETDLNTYNATYSKPLAVGQYYDLASAIAAVPVANRKLGLKLTYMSAFYEKDTLTITNAPTKSGNVVITLNDVSVSISLNSAIDTNPTLVATKIKAATFTGWTVGGTGKTVIFTKNSVGTCSAPTFNAGTTGLVAGFIRNVTGTAESIIETQFNGSSIASWTTQANWRRIANNDDLVRLNSDIDELVTLKEDKASKQIISDVRYAALVESGEILPDVLYYTYEE